MCKTTVNYEAECAAVRRKLSDQRYCAQHTMTSDYGFYAGYLLGLENAKKLLSEKPKRRKKK